MSIKKVPIRHLTFGEGILIQSMTNTRTTDVEATVRQIRELEAAGCDLVRVSVPDRESALAIRRIRKEIRIPLVADIHFDASLAILAVENGADKIRINPGNFAVHAKDSAERDRCLSDIVACCREHRVPIRVGVNAGSLDAETERRFGRGGRGLCESALRSVKMLEDLHFEEIVVSVKSSDVRDTISAYRMLSERCDYPLHLGVTEAGTKTMGTVKSDIALGALLADGIGDTIRVSLSGDPVPEVLAAKRILRALNLDSNWVEVIACPTCARTGIPVEELALRVEAYTQSLRVPMKIAIMGCVVNGIGESKGADFGIAGGKERSSLFVDGNIVETVDNDRIWEVLVREIDRRVRLANGRNPDELRV